MKPNVNSLERAFELARAGTFESVDDIKGQLHQEGYSSKSIVGKHLSAQLRDLIRLSHREGIADPEKLRGDLRTVPIDGTGQGGNTPR